MPEVTEVTGLADIAVILSKNRYTLIDFAAEAWCQPCKAFKPHFDWASDKVSDVEFIHVDVDNADSDLLKHFGIQAVPTVVLFDNNSFSTTVVEARAAAPLVRELKTLTSPPE